MISVAIATYNGEKFIKEQMDSIFNQTMLPDEIVIYDDNSSDNTLNILRQYNNKNIKMIIEKNERNQGYKMNFYNAIKKCSGDYIFLCDQDDIWKSNKIELMISEMKKNNNILLLCSNLKSFYIENCKNKIHQKNIFSIKRIKKLYKYKYFVNTPRPGCTFCINKNLVDIYIEKVDFTIFHDNLLWHIASINRGTYILNKQTMLYRRHSSNVSNNKSNTISKRLEAIREQIKSLNYMLSISKDIRINKFLYKQKELFKKRSKNLQKRNILGLFLLLRYIKYYGFRLWLVDLYYCTKE